jgi:hypothetical protein
MSCPQSVVDVAWQLSFRDYPGHAGSRKLLAYSSGYSFRPREPVTPKVKLAGLEIKSYIMTFKSIWELPTPSPTASPTASRSPTKSLPTLQTVNATGIASTPNRNASSNPIDSTAVLGMILPVVMLFMLRQWFQTIVMGTGLNASVTTASNSPGPNGIESSVAIQEPMQRRRETGHVVNPATASLPDDSRPPLFAAMWIVLIGSLAVGLLACGRSRYFRGMFAKGSHGDEESGHGKGS